jgi:hypothetical protein
VTTGCASVFDRTADAFERRESRIFRSLESEGDCLDFTTAYGGGGALRSARAVDSALTVPARAECRVAPEESAVQFPGPAATDRPGVLRGAALHDARNTPSSPGVAVVLGPELQPVTETARNKAINNKAAA